MHALTLPGNFRNARIGSKAPRPHASRWEFWPAWAVYAPLLPYLAWLSLKYGGPTVFTAANPAIPLGGLVGESKHDILTKLSGPGVLPSTLLDAATVEHRMNTLDIWAYKHNIIYPLILKPDTGQRGAGVRLARSRVAAAEYLSSHPGPVLAQKFHPGPFEAGVFYIRNPGSATGRIFSVTDKVFPFITGDGAQSIQQLILAHPRLVIQTSVFLRRLGTLAARIPAPGEVVPLAIAGNHCQGTMFRDGPHLATPALASALDQAVSTFEGFCFGRFDLRYSSPSALVRGEDFGIVELNGVLSESTNMYDPSMSFWDAQRILRSQWHEAFAIGRANIAHGARAAGLLEVLDAVGTYCDHDSLDTSSD